MKIRFQVDPCNVRTALFQHVAVNNFNGPSPAILPLSNTNDLHTDKEFSISTFLIHQGETYVNLDNNRITCHRKLPKEWAEFERWSGYGVVGNPHCPFPAQPLIKIVPYNIASFSFSKDGKTYSIHHTNTVSMQKKLEDLVIPDKYATAAAKAREAAAAVKYQRAKAARTKYMHPKFSNTNQELKLKLTQQLANGSIDMEAFKMGMAALG